MPEVPNTGEADPTLIQALLIGFVGRIFEADSTVVTFDFSALNVHTRPLNTIVISVILSFVFIVNALRLKERNNTNSFTL